MHIKKMKLFLGSVLLVTFGCILFVIALTKIPNELISHDNDWIGFYGAVIGSLLGGYITFIGVQISIDHTDSIRIMNEDADKERKRLEILPHITAEIRLIDVTYNEIFDCCDYEIGLKFRNIGKDNCINVVVTIDRINLMESESSDFRLFFRNSIVKNEYTNEEFIIINEIDSLFNRIDVDFMDLELRRYNQIIDISFIFFDYTDIEDAEIDVIVESKIPKLSGQ